MKQKHIATPLALLVSSLLLNGCTHYVVEEVKQKEAPVKQVQVQPEAKHMIPVSQQPIQAQTMPATATQTSMMPTNNMDTTQAQVNQHDCGPRSASSQYINDSGSKVESINVRVSGYGAPPKAFYPEPQRRLMAMRAAKIDAYRSLAERVYGVQIWGGTTIGDMVVEKDRFRVYLDTHLSGARVIAENPMEDGTFETTVELLIGSNFLQGAGLRPVNQDCSNMKTVPASANMHGKTASNNFTPVRRNSSPNSDFYFAK